MASYLSYRNVLLSNSTVIASTLNAGSVSYSTLTGSTMSTRGLNFSTITGSTITVSTLTGSTMTGTTVFFSTMTASTILTAGSTINLARNVNVPNRFVEIGCDLADSMYLDFHSKDSALPDYSARIISQGGATTGTGNLNMYASTIGMMCSAGVGIGTTAPTAALHIKNATTAMRISGNLTNASTRPAVSTTPGSFEIRGSSATDGADDGFLRLSAGSGSSANQQAYIDLSGYSTVADMGSNIVFGAQGTERMRITAAGYVGIGTAAPTSALQLGAGFTTDLGTGLKTQYNQVTSITAASVRNGSDWAYGGTYGGTGPYTWTTNIASGSYFTISTGITAGATYQVSFTASGTAGSSFGFGSFSATLTTSLTTYTGLAPNLTSYGLYVNVYGPSGTVFTFSNITFQRLDTLANGFVGIGTDAPLSRLEVYNNSGAGGTTQATITSWAGGATTTNTAALNLRVQGAGGGSVDNIISGQYSAVGAGTYSLAFKPGGTTTMTVVGNGFVGIGITNPSATLHANTTSVSGGNASQIARFDGGDILVGWSSYANTSYNDPGYSAVQGISLRQYNNSCAIMCATTYIPFVATKYGIGTVYMATFSYASAVGVAPAMIGSITHTATTVAYTSASDARLKENITDVSNIRETLNKLRPRTFYFIRDEEKDLHIGFIAQEVKENFPQYVSGRESETEYLSMDYGKFSPFAIAACKDLYNENDALKARVIELESRLSSQVQQMSALEARLAAAGL